MPSVFGTAFRRTTFSFPALNPFNDSNFAKNHLVSIDHILSDGTFYDPGVFGPLAGIDYSEARRNSIGLLSTRAAIRQGGVIYRSTFNIVNKTGDVGGFEIHEAPCMRFDDFWDGLGNRPDFSASGGPIEFGYQRELLAPATQSAFDISPDFDDLRVVLYSEDNPNCLDPPPPSPPQPALEVTKAMQPQFHLWNFDSFIPYEITVTNISDVLAEGVRLGEFVPIRTTYQAVASSDNWVCEPGPGEGSFCTLDIGDLAPGASSTVDFPVGVDEGTPDDWEVFNEAFVDSFSGPSAVLWPDSRSTLRVEAGRPDVESAIVGRDEIRAPRGGSGVSYCNHSDPKCVTFNEALAALGGCCYEFFVLGTECNVANSVLPPEQNLAGRSTLEPEADGALDPFLLYQLRDRIFRYAPGGRRAIDLFFGFIGDMADTSALSSDAPQLALDWILGWQPLLRRLIDGRGETRIVTAGHSQLIIDYVASLKASATTPELLASLELQEARLDIPSWVGLDMNEWLEALNVLSCEPSDTVLCLNNGRFRVEAEWLKNNGDQGHGRAVQLTSDTGYFWFFDPANVEMLVKALDNGCGLQDVNHPLRNFWLFAAGLTDVEVLLSVTDTETGEVQEYVNPQKTKFLPIQDTAAFPTCDAPGLPQPEAQVASYDLPYPPIPQEAEEVGNLLDRMVDTAKRFLGFDSASDGDSLVGRGASSTCVEDATTLCLNNDRFKVTASWETAGGSAGSGQAVALTDDTGYFWFFDDTNVEVVVKALFGGCGLPQGHALRNFWIFGAGLTNVEVDLVVEDTLTGDIRTYHNDQGTRFQPIQDTMAFPTCDAI